MEKLMQSMFILHAYLIQNDQSKHDFIECFTSMIHLMTFLENHPEVTKKQITMHDVNPL
jgi:hypothetical protein